jgi:hypothetical protein
MLGFAISPNLPSPALSYARSQLIGQCAGERRHAEERPEAERRARSTASARGSSQHPGVQPH